MAEKRRGASEAAAAFDTFVGYTRVSTGKQAENGPSLQAQQDRMLARIADHGSKLLGIYRDVGSAYTPSAEREELTDAIRDARAHNVPLLVPSVDRLARNLDVLPRLVRRAATSPWPWTGGAPCHRSRGQPASHFLFAPIGMAVFPHRGGRAAGPVKVLGGVLRCDGEALVRGEH